MDRSPRRRETGRRRRHEDEQGLAALFVRRTWAYIAAGCRRAIFEGLLMKVMTLCVACLQQFGMPRFSTAALLRLPEEGLVELTCDLGHETAGVIQNEKFDILAQMALEAIVDEHFSAAVMSFASALERLCEYFVAIVCRSRGIDAVTFERAWKPMASLSERQLGAFLTAFLLDTGGAAPRLPTSSIELRNKVAHKGHIATRAEAVAFGQAVMDCAHAILTRLGDEAHEKTAIAATFDLLRARGGATKSRGVTVATVALASILERRTGPEPVSIEKALGDLIARPDFTQAVAESHAFGQRIDPFLPPLPVK